MIGSESGLFISWTTHSNCLVHNLAVESWVWAYCATLLITYLLTYYFYFRFYDADMFVLN